MRTESAMSRIEYHLKNPDISTNDYVENCHNELGDSVSRRTRIYLDTKYWLILRDVLLNRSNIPDANTLLEALRKGVQSHRVICPISESTFIELMKQTDPVTRMASAKLVDSLSEGVCLRPTTERACLEIQHLLSSTMRKSSPPPLETLVWSKVSYVLGVQHPINEIFQAHEQQAIQKAFFDHMWGMSMGSMFETLSVGFPQADNFGMAVDRINADSAQHSSELRSFKDAYRAEVRGYLECYMEHARHLIEALAPNMPIPHQGSCLVEHERMLLNLFTAAIEKPNGPMALRTIHVGASCHAAVRWDKKRKLEANDLYDFHNAEAAIGYCHAFLTERPLKTLLSQNHLGLSSSFSCRPLATYQEALDWVLSVGG